MRRSDLSLSITLMRWRNADAYVDFVMEQVELAKLARSNRPDEQHLDFSCYVPDGFEQEIA